MSVNAQVYGVLCGAGRRRHSATDPHFGQVVFLGHFDGTNGSTTFINSCPRGTTVAANGTAVLSTSNQQFGTACLSLDATNTSYATSGPSSDYIIGTGDFTLEVSVYATSTGRFDGQGLFGGANVPTFEYSTGTPGSYACTFNGATINSGGVQAANQMVQLAWCRQAGINYMFVKGVKVGATPSSAFNSSGNTFKVGKGSSFDNDAHKIDEVRLTVGYARYTATYTPATSAFPNS